MRGTGDSALPQRAVGSPYGCRWVETAGRCCWGTREQSTAAGSACTYEVAYGPAELPPRAAPIPSPQPGSRCQDEQCALPSACCTAGHGRRTGRAGVVLVTSGALLLWLGCSVHQSRQRRRCWSSSLRFSGIHRIWHGQLLRVRCWLYCASRLTHSFACCAPACRSRGDQPHYCPGYRQLRGTRDAGHACVWWMSVEHTCRFESRPLALHEPVKPEPPLPLNPVCPLPHRRVILWWRWAATCPSASATRPRTR